MRRPLAAAAALTPLALTLAPAHAVAARPGGEAAAHTVTAGDARFEVLSPTLVRTEWSATGAFDDAATETALGRADMLAGPAPAFTVTRTPATVTIDTGALTLTYVVGSTLTAGLTVTLHDGGQGGPITPTWDPCQQHPSACQHGGEPGTVGTDPTVIGGWVREAVSEKIGGSDVRLAEHRGVLDTNGWYLLDDTATALRPDGGDGAPVAAPRTHPTGTYQDGYFFGYGTDLAQGLADLNAVTGRTTILPEWAFGPWFSDFQAFSARDYEQTIVPAFRSHGTPVDGLVVDTDWKSPDGWNGWQFAPSLFPDPAAFFAYAHAQGLHTTLNIHPSIDATDPSFPKVESSGVTAPPLDCRFYESPVDTGTTPPSRATPCYVFDWSSPSQTAAYLSLHQPLEAAGVDNFWLDWCCDASQVSGGGLTPDSWINDLYSSLNVGRGSRNWTMGEAGSGVIDDNDVTSLELVPATGPWAAHRGTLAVTGDTASDFSTLAYEAQLVPGEAAAIDESYVSNDIGGYTVPHDPDDLYARFVQMGTFSGIDRLHGKHADRLPWQYADGSGADVSAERFLRLREALVPYLYTAAAEAHETGLPMERAMAVAYPTEGGMGAPADEWMMGDSLLVAPLTTPGATASRSLWVPPGTWTDFFTGEQVQGPATITTPAEGFDRMPVYLKAGAPLVMAPPAANVEAAAAAEAAGAPVAVRVAPGAAGSSSVYEDAGDGQGYLAGQRSSTPITYDEPSAGAGRVVIGPRQGAWPGAPSHRAWAVQFAATSRPAVVTVDGTPVAATADAPGTDPTSTPGTAVARDSWSYDPTARTVTVLVAPRATGSAVTVAHDLATPAPALPEGAPWALAIGAGGAVAALWRRAAKRRSS